jgi:hypothetical protein
MPMTHDEYHYAECDGPSKNIRFTTCQSTSDGVWGTKEDGIKAAVESGWSQQGNKMLCPLCTAALPTPRPQQPRRKATTPAAVVGAAESFSEPRQDGQNSE